MNACVNQASESDGCGCVLSYLGAMQAGKWVAKYPTCAVMTMVVVAMEQFTA